MAVLMVTKDTGGIGRPTEMTVVPPDRQVSMAALDAIREQTGLDGALVAGALSAAAMHERAAARFGHAAVEQSRAAPLRQLHESLARTHTSHLEALEATMVALGINPMYASPISRMAHHLTEGLLQAPLLAGSVSDAAMEMVRLNVARVLVEGHLAAARGLSLLAVHGKPSAATAALQQAADALVAEAETASQAVRTAWETVLVTAAMEHGAQPAGPASAEPPSTERPAGP